MWDPPSVFFAASSLRSRRPSFTGKNMTGILDGRLNVPVEFYGPHTQAWPRWQCQWVLYPDPSEGGLQYSYAATLKISFGGMAGKEGDPFCVFPTRWWMRHVTEALEKSSPTEAFRFRQAKRRGSGATGGDLIGMSLGPGVGLRRTSLAVTQSQAFARVACGVLLHLHSHMVVFKPVQRWSKQPLGCDA
ncbi:hypothetical protein ACRE_046270 [Hapsidospora chrysogenum ATCC 11550]|uniref:Uncharacterized protein n=1 Tax=Hapsidospora chrysogenum (strain ATCC 11550 / CBS 779.69 / DSM 880 / IAM 14645 / JCM 23072 / IMI 49137) TaxID=857340 RepID=A0A086T5D7_HAPC1|nr:hypothetical protein ACRE_046270 [Hapsidospora chrysogenum ATCC 11550]